MPAQFPYTLTIGTKNWSSWSLRPWLLMRQAGIPFEEVEIALREPGTKAAIEARSPSGLVPVLAMRGGLVVWDSLAIAELLAERHPDRALWPADPDTCALARCAAAEMHAGFRSLRMQMPMDCASRIADVVPSEETETDIARITAIWRNLRGRFAAGGPFLFGAFSIADAMYAPVVTRFRTYGVALSPVEERYAETIMALPAMRDWMDACAAWARARR